MDFPDSLEIDDACKAAKAPKTQQNDFNDAALLAQPGAPDTHGHKMLAQERTAPP